MIDIKNIIIYSKPSKSLKRLIKFDFKLIVNCRLSIVNLEFQKPKIVSLNISETVGCGKTTSSISLRVISISMAIHAP